MANLAERFKAILLQRCPRCLHGSVFSRLVTMRPTCPVCGHRFEREPGYFLGALYVSYFLSIPLLGLLTLLLYWLVWPDGNPAYLVLAAAVPYLVLMPWVFRYARVVWMHIDAP